MHRLTGLVCIVSLATAALGFSILAIASEGARWIVEGLTEDKSSKR